MKRALSLILLPVLIMLAGCAAKTRSQPAETPVPVAEAEAVPMTAADIFANYIDSVVHIEGAGGGGTGFFIEENTIATNNHVIAGNEWLTVKTSDGSVYDVLEVIAVCENPDLALLRVDFEREPLSLNTHGLREGEDVYALGAPMGIYPCISDGIIMKSSHEDNGVNYILSNYHSIGGNSGGPVLNAYGELVGIVVGGISDGPNSIDLVINAEHLAELEAGEIRRLSTKAEYLEKMNRPDEENYELAELSQAQPGQLVKLGHYEQDGKSENGAEDILWLVMEREGEELVAMSLYCLDVVPYHNEYTAVTWENSGIRRFLNGEFLSTAFSAEEEAMLLTSTVVNEPNPVYGTSCGSITYDRVYLPSLQEIMGYYGIAQPVEQPYSQLYAQATPYVCDKGVWLEIPDSTRCWWWLRSNGGSDANACEVGSGGYLSFNGTQVDNSERAIRPVIRINAA